MQYFETRFLKDADKFISELDPKATKKLFYNIDLAEQSNDPKLFKKLQKEIWEFRAVQGSGLNMQDFKFVYLPFGIKRT